MGSAGQGAAWVVVIHAGERTWRMALDVALRERGMRTRLSSRPAELAKTLTDAAARVIVAGPADTDQAMVTAARPTCVVVTARPGEPLVAIVARTLAALDGSPASAPARQVTSSE